MKSLVSFSLCELAVVFALLSVHVAAAQSLSLSVIPKDAPKLSYEMTISNPTDANIKIRGITMRSGALAPFKANDTYISPFMAGTVSEASSPYFEVEVQYAFAPVTRFTIPDERAPTPQQKEYYVFVFPPQQTFTFQRFLREHPTQITVKYFDGYQADKTTSVLWKK